MPFDRSSLSTRPVTRSVYFTKPPPLPLRPPVQNEQIELRQTYASVLSTDLRPSTIIRPSIPAQPIPPRPARRITRSLTLTDTAVVAVNVHSGPNRSKPPPLPPRPPLPPIRNVVPKRKKDMLGSPIGTPTLPKRGQTKAVSEFLMFDLHSYYPKI